MPEEKEQSTTAIMCRVSPSLKEQAKQRAVEEERSLSNYVKRLIQQDIEEYRMSDEQPRRKLV